MSLKKFSIIILIIFVLSINTVNAEDGSLSNLQVLVDGSDNVDLNTDFSFKSGDSQVHVSDKDITINGNNHVIDGKNSSKLFTFEQCNVYIENLTFINGYKETYNYEQESGAIDFISSKVTLKNCKFMNNYGSNGGAIYAEKCDLLIDNSYFSNNYADMGAAISLYCANDENILISNSIFNDNNCEFNLEIIGPPYVDYSIGETLLWCSDNLLDNQVYLDSHNDNLNLTFVNVDYNNFKNKSFIVKSEDDLEKNCVNETIRFEVYDGDTLLINTTNTTNEIGRTNIDYDNITPGYYYLKVYYKDLSDTERIKVEKDSKLSISLNNITVGEDLVVYISNPYNITEHAHIYIRCENSFSPIDVDVDLGKNSPVRIPFLPVGTYELNFYYVPDLISDFNYKIVNIYMNFTVFPNPNATGIKTIIKANKVYKYFGGSERLCFNLTDEKGNPLSNKNISITINGASYTRKTDDSGKASLAINLGTGEYRAGISFEGDDAYDSSLNSTTIHIESTVSAYDLRKYVGDNSIYGKFNVFVYDSEGEYLKEGQVKFNINGVIYHRNIQKGYAGLNINLAQGDYIITTTNPVTSEMTSCLISVLPTITNNHNLVKYFKNDSQFTVSVKPLDDDDDPVVSFNINGVFYKKKVDGYGIAKLNINLGPGNYIITSIYKGCMVSNNITVLPVLNASDLKMRYKDGSTFNATLVDGQGRPLANENVTFNINGVFYQRTTDEKGIAKLNINLQKGEYIITSSYNGCDIANKITILS